MSLESSPTGGYLVLLSRKSTKNKAAVLLCTDIAAHVPCHTRGGIASFPGPLRAWERG